MDTQRKVTVTLIDAEGHTHRQASTPWELVEGEVVSHFTLLFDDDVVLQEGETLEIDESYRSTYSERNCP